MIIACGGRNDAFQRFKREAERTESGVCVLLVDSEMPVAANVAPFLHLRNCDGWNFDELPTNCVFLMVQAMEAWLMADRDALARFYGQGFRLAALAGDARNVEVIPKCDLVASLLRATHDAQGKGPYHKTNHAFTLLTEIDPNKVAAASPHAAAFQAFLQELK